VRNLSIKLYRTYACYTNIKFHFIITLLNDDNVLLCVIYQLNFTVLMHVTRISGYMTLYIAFGIIRGFP